eukprot:tig00020960_g16526.t1
MAGKTLDWIQAMAMRMLEMQRAFVAGAQAAGLRREWEDSWRALVIERRRECVGLVEEAEEAFGLPPRKWRRWPHGRSALTDLGPRAIRTQARQPSLGPVAPARPRPLPRPLRPAPAPADADPSDRGNPAARPPSAPGPSGRGAPRRPADQRLQR